MPLIDVTAELQEHYDLVKQVAQAAASDPDETGSSKASTLNAVTSILKELAKIQTDLYNSSSIAALQQAIVDELKLSDPTITKQILENLETRLSNLKTS
jgi:hypothetical protein